MNATQAKSETIAAVATARKGDVRRLSDLVDNLRFKGFRHNGTTYRLDYKNMVAWFAQAGVDAEEFEELMMECDSVER